MIVMSMARRDWSELPRDILTKIAEDCIETHLQTIQFRAVCNSWRSSVPLPTPSLASPVVLPLTQLLNYKTGFCQLLENTIYTIRPKQLQPESCSKLLLVQVDVHAKHRNVINIIDPLSNIVIKPIPRQFPRSLNILDYKICGFYKEYYLVTIDSNENCNVRKVTLSSSGSINHLVVMGFDSLNKLVCFRSGDERWMVLDDKERCRFKDVILYKGQFYAVDSTRRVCTFDPHTLDMTVISNSVVEESWEQRLLESNGDLYLIDCQLFRVGCRVFKLNEKEKQWIRVKNLGDSVFSFGDNHSYFMSALDFPGLKGNCLLLVDYMFKPKEKHITVFDIEDATFGSSLSAFKATHSYFGITTAVLE